MNQLPTYSKLIVNHYTNKPLLTVTTIVHTYDYIFYISSAFRAYGPGYIHSPSQWAGREISSAFRAHGPGYIHSPSQWASWEISHAFRAHGPGYIHSPSQRAGREISRALRAHGLGYITPLHRGPAKKYHMPLGTRVHGPSSVSQVIYH